MLEDLVGFAVGAFAIIMALFLAFFLCDVIWTLTVDRSSCKVYPELYGMESKWDFWAGCAVKTEAGWMPKDSWKQKNIQDRHEVTIKQ